MLGSLHSKRIDFAVSGRRTKNFHKPDQADVGDSVEALIAAARTYAEADHRNSFVAKKERDLIAEVYLDRAKLALQEENE